jgi:trypsin-like peptidase/VWA domain-containing protein
MSHIVGTLQTVSPSKVIGPNSSFDFIPSAAPGGTKLAMLHFKNATFPGNSHLEVDLGYGTDIFTAADGTDFWTRPVNIYVPALGGLNGKVPIRTIGSASVELFEWVRGEEHVGEPGHPSKSNCDPFQAKDVYVEPTYDPSWFCVQPPAWANLEKVVPPDIRAVVGRSVGMIVTVEKSLFTDIIELSTCSVTLVDTDKILTAGHCHTPAEALNSSVTFDYRLTDDGKRPNPYTCRWFKVKSVVAHHNSGVTDYSILQLAEAPVGIPIIQIRHDLPGVGEPVFGVHHPNGAPKKLSVAPPLFTTIASSSVNHLTVFPSFHASGGSSGSGLFDQAGRILGVMTGGEPCEGGALEFFPTASIMKDLVPVPPSPVTRDVMVVFDRSGSMSLDDGTGRQKIEAARDAVSLFIQLIKSNAGNRLGLVSFSTTPSNPVDHALADLDDLAKFDLIGTPPFSAKKVGALTPNGLTSIGEGLDKARLEYPAPGQNPALSCCSRTDCRTRPD